MRGSRRRIALALRLVVVAAVVTFLCAFASRLDWHSLRRSIACARPWPLAFAALLPFAMLWSKATCWRILLAPRHHVPVRRLFRYTIAAYAASALAPMRAGELLRVWILKHRDGVPVGDGAAVAVCERVLDGAAMFALVLPALCMLPALPGELVGAAVGGATVVAALVVALALLAPRCRDSAKPSWFVSVLARFDLLRSAHRALGGFAVLCAAWLFDLAMVELVLAALGVPLPPQAALVVLLAINLAIAVPATPGEVGIHEAGALVGLAIVHVPAESAFAFAIVYHAIQVLPVIVAGLALEWRLVLGLRT